MAWQGLLILGLVIGHTEYYADKVYVLRDAIEGVIGYSLFFDHVPCSDKAIGPEIAA